ncbi:phosphotransferase [Paraburkholderia agricolaris]|uniref:phosphotransferase family protein n=1 Tax=Paraburkholderia agricolaris TaxID=2152888 RepID=UPI0038B83135
MQSATLHLLRHAPGTNVIDNEEAIGLVRAALHVDPLCAVRQFLTQSGNCIFRVDLPEGKSTALRVSPQRNAFAYTHHNLDILRAMGLPVQTVLASGETAAGGSFVILNWIPGRDLAYELPQMRSEQMTRVAETVTDYQKRVGCLPRSDGFGWAPIGGHPTFAQWTNIFGEPATDSISVDATPLAQLRARLRAVRRSVEPHFASISPTCFLDDLTTKNVLVESGRLQGVIDCDTVCYGDPLMSVGTTLAHLAADVGEACRFYGQELIRCWNPQLDALRAIRFYAALWVVGFMAAAETAGEIARATELAGIADAMLSLAET